MLVEKFSKEYIDQNILVLLNQLGDDIKFEDNTWVCNKKRKSASTDKTNYTLYFKTIPEKYKVITKYYCLAYYRGIKSLTGELWNLNYFFNFLCNELNALPLTKVNKCVISQYISYSTNLELSKNSKKAFLPTLRRFFLRMKEYEEIPATNPVKKDNPFHLKKSVRRINEKYLPNFVAKQLDVIFEQEIIPIHFRLIYWILRYIPSRASEALGMKIDCIKPYGKHWIVIMPTWKENGGYLEPESRLIHVKNEGKGKYLLDLINEQRKLAKEYQIEMTNEDKGLLFTVERYGRKKMCELENDKSLFKKYKGKPYVYKYTSARKMVNRLLEFYDVKDEKGSLYKFTTHQLRHKGITDRFYAGFSSVEIRDMTGGKDDTTNYSSYYHPIPEKDREISNNIQRARNLLDNQPIYFNGRIMNMDKDTVERLLKNPRAYEISDGEQSIGICTDIFSCISGVFECLGCNYFAPKVENASYYEREVEKWENKCKLLHNNKQALENAELNLSLHKAILVKIQNELAKRIEENM